MNVPTIFKNVDVVDVVMDTNGRERDKWKYFSSEQKLQRNFFCSFLTSIFELCTIKNSISTKESKFFQHFCFFLFSRYLIPSALQQNKGICQMAIAEQSSLILFQLSFFLPSLLLNYSSGIYLILFSL
jgi:hypothetical protein